MASAPMPLPPPPGGGSAGPAGPMGPGTNAPPASPNPTAPTMAAPAPPTPSPMMEQGTQLAIGVVSNLRSIAKAFPATSDKIAQINDLMRDVVAQMMQGGSAGEPAAPPNG